MSKSPRFVPFPGLKEEFGISYTRQHIDRMVKDGIFPPKVHLSSHRMGWMADDVEKWLESRVAAAKAA
jgi:predicted DNA-binding transcriptional regulator AlpA